MSVPHPYYDCFSFSLVVVDANKTGVAHETIQNLRRSNKVMTEQEARQILGMSEQSTWEEIVQVLIQNLTVLYRIFCMAVLILKLLFSFSLRFLALHAK